MTTPPLVSIVVPTFNRAALLRETLTSLLAQTWQHLQIVVVDNMSVDDTAAAVASFRDPRITCLRHPNGGVIAVNRNLGIRTSSGDYVAFCDDDDVWEPAKLERQVAAMEADPSVGLCYTDGATFRGDAILHPRMVSRRVFNDHFRRLLWDNCIPSSSVMVRRSIFAATGLIDESPRLTAVEDYEMWLRVAHRHKLVFLDSPLIRYRIHGPSAGLKPAAVSLRNVQVLRSVQRKLGLSPWRIALPIVHQYAKHAYFRFADR